MIVQALKSNWKRKFISFLIIIQITISLSTLIDAVIIFEQIRDYKSEINSLKNIKDNYIINMKNVLYESDAENQKNNIISILKGIEDNKKIDYFIASNTDLLIESFKNVHSESKVKELLKAGGALEDDLYASAIDIDENFIKSINLKISEGRDFEKNDFLKSSKEVIPVLVGSDFLGKLKLGSKINGINSTYEVIGFLESNQKFLSGSGSVKDLMAEMKDLKQSVLIPMTKELKEDPVMSFQRLNGELFFSIKNEYKKDELEILKQIVGLIQKEGYNAEIISLDDQLKDILSERISLVKTDILKGIILTAFSILTLNVTMLVFIFMRKREFGIRVSCGASIKDISAQIVIEITVLIVLGLFIHIAFILYNYYSFNNYEYYFIFKNQVSLYSSYNIPFTAIIKSGVLIIFISLCSSIIPIMKIKKISIKDLIRGL